MNKFLLTFILFLTFFKLYVSVSDVCLWKRDGPTNTFLNGLFKYKGLYDSKYYYVMNDTDCRTPVYLYFKSSPKQWVIGPTLGSLSGYYARCMTSNLNLPTLCNGNWYVPSTLDPDVVVTSGDCPYINCDTIVVDFLGTTSNYCEGTYTVKVGNNIYKKSNVDVYFYFNHKLFTWICSPKASLTSCGVSIYGRDTGKLWKNISDQQSMLLSWQDGKSVNVTCQSFPPSIDQQYYLDSYCALGCRQFYNGCNYCKCEGKHSYSCNSINACTNEVEDDRCCCIKLRNNSTYSDSDYTRLAQACLQATTIDDCNNRKCAWQCS